MPITMKDIASAALQLIQKLPVPNKAVKLGDFVGKDAADLIEFQFTADAQQKLKDIVFVEGMATPKLKDLAKELNLKGKLAKNTVAELKKAVESDLSPTTYMALEKFDGGGFVGITYNKTVWVADKSWLSVTLHEMVHCLQWINKGELGFLETYFKALTKGIDDHVVKPIQTGGVPDQNKAYRANPAETQAYKYSEDFEAKMRSGIKGIAGIQPKNYTMVNCKNLGLVATDKDVADLVKAQKSLNISVPDAILGM